MRRFILSGFIIILILFLIQGCISSPGKRYYQLHMEAGKNLPGISKILMVEAVEVDKVYNDYPLVYRLSPYELNYYSYEFWIKKPGQMMQDAVVDYLSKSGSFKKVITKFLEGEPDLLLKAKVNKIEEYDRKDGWFAHLNMEMIIKTLKTGEIVLVHNFDRNKRLSAKKVARVPIALSIILEEELTKVVKQLSEKCN
jgi:uncharacterized lipoprotein YmbA